MGRRSGARCSADRVPMCRFSSRAQPSGIRHGGALSSYTQASAALDCRSPVPTKRSCMRVRRISRAAVAALALAASSSGAQDSAKPLSLWYDTPATQWVEALPVGNGRLGAMEFGGTLHDRIQFNEASVWTGEPHDYARVGAVRYLSPIRQLLYAHRQKEAEDLAQ